MVRSTEIFRMDSKAEKLALFRYALIAPLVIETLPRGQLTRRAEEIAARHYDFPDPQRTGVSVDTLLRWSLRYRQSGFEALSPKPRQDRGVSRAVSPQLASLIERLKRENPHRTGMTLWRELALSSGKDAPAISASTLYRFLKQRGLSEKNCLRQPPTKSSKPNGVTRFGRPICCSAPGSSAPRAVACRCFCTPLWMTPDGSSRTPSFMSAKDWTRCWIACDRQSPAVVCPVVCTLTMPRCIARRNWRALLRHWALW